MREIRQFDAVVAGRGLLFLLRQVRLRYDVKTLDQAFGIERKGERISDRKLRESLKAPVALEVSRLQEKLPIDEALFELVGKKFKIPMGTARDIYYKENAWRQLFEAMPPESYLE